MDLLLVVLIGVIAVAVVTALAQRLGVAGPLLLVALGLGVGLLPFIHVPEIDPEIILVGVLPPLLYASAVRLPAIEFRRDLGPISGLAVFLVVVTALILGWFFSLVLPDVGFALGVALGAILSPTDAVATGIAKRLGISPRVTTMLEGESLLNDATALVLLRTALIAVVAGTFSFGASVGSFLWAIVIAVTIGGAVGLLAVRLRAWVGNSAASTAIGFTVPFIAYLPTEHLNGSGLVAAVIAGIVAGQGAQRWFTPEQRLSDQVNWRTVELVLEGGIFLIMGLELDQIVTDVTRRHEGLALPAVVALAALLIILVVRAAYVAFLIWAGRSRAGKMDRSRYDRMDARLDEIEEHGWPERAAGRGRTTPSPERVAKRVGSMRERVARAVADVDYYQSTPLGWKHATVIVWAGMRGVVTLAAAQTIPRTVEDRPVLILIAFLVAFVSLMLQGFTLPWVVRALRLESDGEGAGDRAEQKRIDDELRVAAAAALADPALHRLDGSPFDPALLERMGARYIEPPGEQATSSTRDILELRIALIEAMRARLTQLSTGGTFSTQTLRHTLAELDADQLSVELRLRGQE
ncbi:cation:proton antiporter [Microbacterium dextranolyticum]|uniref:Peptidase n=1 Tax=Microbacterium dextranolyticum TaxID=36806 RepID=A0A9W6HMG1_9MICO|nr:sodium:proton antiporter [Microbacterium dextranolyticum]MBM7464293.1 CPA1 family monovalent cation:H+ antiporter [Microbacterium dextranolyticum]GLJ95290.1 peptidase [Microbacterium dextranolyticum]